MTLAYIAEPIDRAGGERWSERLISELREAGVSAYSPRTAFGIGRDAAPDRRVEHINRAALNAADLMIAYLPNSVPTIGVPREIEAFAALGRPWALMTDIDSYSTLDATARFSLYGVMDAVRWARQQPTAVYGSMPVTDSLLFAKAGEFDGRLPTRAHAGDAGYDLYAAEDAVIPWNQFKDIHCGVRVALPEGVWGRIVGRSSTTRSRGLLVTEGIIDTGYRGELYIGVRNLADRQVTVHAGERIAQLILCPNLAPDYRARWASADEFDAIPHDGRGSAGFGSSGN